MEMKNLIILISLALITSFMLNSCTNESASNGENTVVKSSIINVSLKLEAEKLVDLHCKAINILRKADQVSRDLKNKYSSPEEQEEFSIAYQEALENCPYQ